MPDAPHVPPQLDSVVEGLAGNPALPAGMVRRFIEYRKGMGDVAMRPDLTEDMIAAIIATDDHWLTHTLACNPVLPHAFRMRLAEHPDAAIRRALASRSVEFPRELYERLAGDEDPKVREYLASNEHVPEDLLAHLAEDPHPSVRAKLAQWFTQAPEPVRRRLLTDPDEQVRQSACSTYFARTPRPVPPADLLPALLSDPATRAGAIRHCALDADTADRLAADPDEQVRRQLADHPDLPVRLRAVLAADPDTTVALGIFARKDTPEVLRAEIHARIPSEPLSAARFEDLDADDDAAFERRISDEMARIEFHSMRLPWVTADPLPHVDSPFACFRVSAAMCDNLPEAAVTRLLNDAESSVRATMAQHARDRIDPATAERIDRDYRPDKRSDWRPADDFPLPPEALRRLAADPEPRMRELAPRDPDLPEDLLRRLAADPHEAVRAVTATHGRLPADVLVGLLDDTSAWVAKTAAGNPNLPVAQMDRLLALAGL